MTQDHLAASSPLPEHARVAAFAGEWNGEEVVFASRWTEGGTATSRVVAHMDLNGFYLIQDSVQTRDGKQSFATHASSPSTAKTGPTNCSGTTRSATRRPRPPPAVGSARP